MRCLARDPQYEYAEQVPRGATPAEDARNLAAWLREHSASE
jgi:hypothetical protein